MEFIDTLSNALKPFPAVVSHVQVETALEPDMGENVIDTSLDSRLKDSLISLGITRLYKFQEDAINAIIRGENVLIMSGTGTGKTEAFLVPLIELTLRKGEKSVILYPTKALARDQLDRITKIAEPTGISVAVLDGDVSAKEREKIYEKPPDILITNPDMLHLGLSLSYKFRDIIRGSDHFVFDEIHAYEGVLGSHIRMICERLKEFTNNINVISSSATIGATPYMFQELFGVPGKIIQGIPRRKGMAIHALVDSKSMSRWTLSAFIAAKAIKEGLKTLVFVDSQQMAEVTAKIADRFGVNMAVHRAGLIPKERIRVEKELKSGMIMGIVATPTLELGIDIGDLDVVIMAENPPSYPKYVQRAGRSGRRNKIGYVITVMGDDPIDSYFLRNPKEFFSRKLTPIPFDTSNLEVIKVHVGAYLIEKGKVKISDLPPLWAKAAKELDKEGKVTITGNYLIANRKTLDFVKNSSLRNTGPIVRIYDNEKKIGERELPIALYDLYPNAVYLVSKRTYIVEKLDLKSFRAQVKRSTDVSYYTKPLYDVELVEFNELDKRKVYGLPVAYGETKVKISVKGYVIKSFYENEKHENKTEFDDPLQFTYTTKGLIIKHPVLDGFGLVDSMEAYHATEHVLISAGRVVAGASMTDLSGMSYPSGHVIIYDSVVGGSGVSKLMYSRLEDAYEIALDIVGKCDCEDGCPKCIYSPYCGNNNKVLSRRKSFKLIQEVIKGNNTSDERIWGNSVS
ncbi:DEAD/DEAH box helicase [Candidatus Acidianus copahuensis]|uniref:DEAD/DEAH box helicase n=1 Tax=Candidatus Acidianus copahuensis TaxID=1160895 RepID=A0A031LL93_9CREN|nr:DEAD/DEAH box helicase [Candidatus Acidianus copahuensis]EZQ04812.1 DEAD/DEAH box helicase [Candidatus Acidianus copahuensis]